MGYSESQQNRKDISNWTLSDFSDFLWDCSPSGGKYSCQVLLLMATKILEQASKFCQKELILRGTGFLTKVP
jgi:hypothetical protein